MQLRETNLVTLSEKKTNQTKQNMKKHLCPILQDTYLVSLYQHAQKLIKS